MSRFLKPSASLLLVALTAAAPSAVSAQATAPAGKRRPDVMFVPTPQEVVDRMLELAKVKKGDVVYDLGCGDGRILVTAARKYAARGLGTEIDPFYVRAARRYVREAGVEDLVRIQEQDFFTQDLSGASVVTLYLQPHLNVRLIPQLEKLKPGSRIVSHSFDMKGIKPQKVVKFLCRYDGTMHTLYLWITPLKKEKDPRVITLEGR